MRLFCLVGFVFVGMASSVEPVVSLDDLSRYQKELFTYAMDNLDSSFGVPFLFNSPRYSAWYSVGLLAGNKQNDATLAAELIRNVIDYQYTDPSKIWFGTFKNSPEEPDPGVVYPPKLYTSYDLNQALFVCTSWIVVVEEFQHLLEPELVKLMKESMYNATIGDGYRVGGIDGDNLYPVYSNPWYMRVMAATYVGNMMNDTNMTYWGNIWAHKAVEEFDRYGTLSEFNSGTYTGVTLYALSLWGYMPKNSTIATRAKDIISKTWASIGEYYNPTLGTLGGPWDRAYGFDMRKYFGILGAQITGLVGGIEDGTAPIPNPLIGSEHYSDAAAIPLTTLLSKFHDPYVPVAVLKKLKRLQRNGHSYFAQAVSPPFESLNFPRNYTSWTVNGLSVGGIEVDGKYAGGASTNSNSFTPGVILWDTGARYNGWISHYATSPTISSIATSRNLTISYPISRAFPSNSTSNVMTFLISGFRRVSLQSNSLSNGTADLPGLRLQISGNVITKGTRSFVYGIGSINDIPYYNLTYVIPEGLGEVPSIVFSFTKL